MSKFNAQTLAITFISGNCSLSQTVDRVAMVKCVILQNMAVIGHTVTQISRFFDFQDGGRPPSWIIKIWKILLADGVQRVELYHRAKFGLNRSNPCSDIAIFWFFKMTAVCRLGFVVSVFGNPWRAFSGHICCSKFVWNGCSSFDNMHVVWLCEFGLKMPVHASKIGILGYFWLLPPTFREMSTKPRKGTSLRDSTSFRPKLSCTKNVDGLVATKNAIILLAI